MRNACTLIALVLIVVSGLVSFGQEAKFETTIVHPDLAGGLTIDPKDEKEQAKQQVVYTISDKDGKLVRNYVVVKNKDTIVVRMYGGGQLHGGRIWAAIGGHLLELGEVTVDQEGTVRLAKPDPKNQGSNLPPEIVPTGHPKDKKFELRIFLEKEDAEKSLEAKK